LGGKKIKKSIELVRVPTSNSPGGGGMPRKGEPKKTGFQGPSHGKGQRVFVSPGGKARVKVKKPPHTAVKEAGEPSQHPWRLGNALTSKKQQG